MQKVFTCRVKKYKTQHSFILNMTVATSSALSPGFKEKKKTSVSLFTRNYSVGVPVVNCQPYVYTSFGISQNHQ